MSWGRRYFAVQAAGGAAWWLLVANVPAVRQATLGSLDPVPVALLDVPLFVVGSALAAVGVRAAATVATGWTALVATALTVRATLTGEAGLGVLVMLAATIGSVLALCLVRLGRLPVEWVTAGPLRFRTADADRTVAGNVRRTVAQIVVFWGLFLAVFPTVIVFLEHRWRLHPALPQGLTTATAVTGWVVLAAASALGIAAAAVMSTLGEGTPLPSDQANRLVVAGPYRAVRNPMALAGITQGVAVGLVASSWMVVIYAVVGSVVWNCVVRPLEEADLERRFGDDFRRYRDAVRCWVPRWPVPRSPGADDVSGRRAIRQH